MNSRALYSVKICAFKRHRILARIFRSSIISGLVILMESSCENSKPKYKPVTHVIFDLDGLLIDSGKCYHKIDEAVIGKYGKEVPENMHLQLLGYSDQDCAEKIIEICDLKCSAEEYLNEVREHVSLLKDTELLPGAERLIRHFARHKIPMGIATSSSEEHVHFKLHNYDELFSLINHKVMGSSDPEVLQCKPAPDIFLVCAKRFPDKPAPEQCLVLEDAPSGVLAAKRAGMQVILVPEEKLAAKHRENATMVINSLLDFNPESFGLPPFSD